MVAELNQKYHKSILHTAMILGGWGWSLIPTKQNKKPACERWGQYQKQAADRAKLRRWFKKPVHGIAAIMGAVSHGIVCRDFDRMDAYEAWATSNPGLASELPTAETGRDGGGRHVYFRMESIPPVLAGKTCHVFKDGSGEFRFNGCYVILPPSIHESGQPYRWLIPPTDQIPKLEFENTGFFPNSTLLTNAVERRREAESTAESSRSNVEQVEQLEIVEAISGERCFEKKNTVSDLIEIAVLESLPKKQGRRNQQVFELCRALKAIPELKDVPPEKFEDIVRKWHKLALPFIATKPFPDTWIDFLHGWPNVKFPKGDEPMVEVFRRAATADVPTEALEKYDDHPQLQLLAALCRELQRVNPDKPFHLSCLKAAKFFNKNKPDSKQAWRWLWLLEHDGIIKETTKGGPETNKATRFRYLGKL